MHFLQNCWHFKLLFLTAKHSLILPGWNYAKLTDVMVHRVHDGEPLSGPRDTAELVYSNGCRNPGYRPLAPSNPWRDSANTLINNFDFRVFMFQEMQSGDSIMITAKVIACVEKIDCAPVSFHLKGFVINNVYNFEVFFSIFFFPGNRMQ